MPNEFTTSDLGLACFLSAKHIKLKAIERDPDSTYEKPRGVFVFFDEGKCEKLREAYNSNNSESRMVDAKKHFYEIKKMKNTLHYNLGFRK